MFSRLLRRARGNHGADSGRRLPIPFVSTPFAFDLMLVLMLWPLWWVLGVEQLLPPFFLAWEMGRYLIRARGHFTVAAPVVWAGLLAVWWIVPAMWLDREYIDIFLKETASAWSQVIILFLFWNTVRTASEWRQAARGLKWLAAFIAVGGVVFVFGLWQGSLVSAVGSLLPDHLAESSTFFRSIATRRFGSGSAEKGSVFALRASSLALTPSALSMMTLLLIPLTVWYIREAAGRIRGALGLVLAGLLVCFIAAESRIAYLAFLVCLFVYGFYALGLFRKRKRLVQALAAVACVSVVVFVAVVGLDRIAQTVRDFFLSWRPGSWLVRLRVYDATIDMLPSHPIAGWGVQMALPGTRTSFSAGSHSSILGMFFRHGIVGLALYVGLWVSIWREIVRGLKVSPAKREMRGFWIAAAIAMLGFNIREMADTWWWDQTITMTIWTIWGLIIAAPASMPGLQPNAAAIAEQEQTS